MFSKLKREKRKETVEETPPCKPREVYLKALPMTSIEDVDLIKQELNSGNILIIRLSPVAKKSIDDVKKAVDELREFTESVGGDIARLSEEQVVITPKFVKIWRERAETLRCDPFMLTK